MVKGRSRFARTTLQGLIVLLVAMLSGGHAAADHVAQAPVERLYSVTFATSGQSVWGPDGTSPGTRSIPILKKEQTDWDADDSVRDRETVLGEHFGGEIGGSTAGHIGMDLGTIGAEVNNIRRPDA